MLEIDRVDGGADRHPLLPGEHLVGRGMEADVVVDDPTLSRSHVRLLVGADGVQLIDLESTNGTRIDDKEVEPGSPVPLEPGTSLEVGSVHGRLLSLPAGDRAGERS